MTPGLAWGDFSILMLGGALGVLVMAGIWFAEEALKARRRAKLARRTQA